MMYLVTFIQEAQYGDDAVSFQCKDLEEVEWLMRFIPNANAVSKARVVSRLYDPNKDRPEDRLKRRLEDRLERRLNDLNESIEASLREAQEDIDSEAMNEEGW